MNRRSLAAILAVLALAACEKPGPKIPPRAPDLKASLVDWFEYYRSHPSPSSHSATLHRVLQFKPDKVLPHLPYLLSCMKDEDVDLRIMVTGVLLNLGQAAHEAGPVLETALRDGDARVRINAARALSLMNQAEDKAVALLFDEASRSRSPYRKVAVDSLRKDTSIGAAALPVIRARLNDSDSIIRGLALVALINMGPPLNLPARADIEARLEDPRGSIRALAKQALDAIAKKT